MGKLNKKEKKSKEVPADSLNETPKVMDGKVKKKKNTKKMSAIEVEMETGEIAVAPVLKAGKEKTKSKKKVKDEVAEVEAESVKVETTDDIETPSDAIEAPENTTESPEDTTESPEDTTEAPADPIKKVRSKHSKPENTVFIGNIPSNTKKKQLTALFSKFGTVVSVRMRTTDGKNLLKHETRKQADTLNAYVVFDNVKSTQKALKLTGTEFKGKHIRVTLAKNGVDDIEPKRVLFIGNLKYSATDEKLYDIFETCGKLEYVRTIRNAKGCNGVAYVCYKKPESATLALELNNTMLDERPIRVQRYVQNKVGVVGKKTSVAEKKVSGSARRVMEKNNRLNKNVKGKGNKFNKKDDSKPFTPKKEKKSDYRGVKTASTKKQKNKNKSTHLQNLAKKIAPK